MEKSGLSVIIPIYNEVESALHLPRRLTTLIDLCDFPLEVVLVDDGSEDGTTDYLQKLEIEGVRILRHKENLGYGAALKTGIHSTNFPWICITDADDTYPDDRIPDLFRQAVEGELAMVIGARIGKVTNTPWLRRPPKWILRKLASILCGHRIIDLNSGLRIMRRDVLERYLHLLPNEFSFTATITLAMLSTGYNIEYTPINYHRRVGRSKIRPIRDTLDFFQLISRTVLWFNPLRIFLPLSFLFFLLSIIIAVGSHFLYGRIMDVSFGVLFMTSVIVLSVGLLADLIDKRMLK